MNRQDLVVGVLVALLCAHLLFRYRWFLERTTKCQRLVAWLGWDIASIALRVFALAGIVFGLLLACGIIRPIQW